MKDILKAQQIREVIKYSQNFKKHTFVLYIDDVIIKGYHFNRLVQDILCLSSEGIRIIIVTGARNSINEIMERYHRNIKFHHNKRVISTEDMELVQMASFDVVARVLNKFAEFKNTSIMGNWISAQGLGVVDGVDYLHAGKIVDFNVEAIKVLLNDDMIPIIPPIGWSITGKPYSLEAIELATKIAIYMHADKLFYIGSDSPDDLLSNLNIESSTHIDISEDNRILRMRSEGAHEIISKNILESESLSYYIMQHVLDALSQRIDRVHLIDGTVDGSLLEELFSPQGSGVMIHNDEYQAIEPLKLNQVEEVLNIMHPRIADGTLVERDLETLRESYQDYVCYIVDRVIYGVAALHDLGDGYAEIAGVVVNSNYNKSGVGRKIIKYLLEIGYKKGYSTLWVLTTTTGDWFESLGFEQTDIMEMPEPRRKKYESQNRGSRVYKYSLLQ